MFNVGISELLIILLIAFLVVGPKDLPKVARALARFFRFLKTKWAEFLQETELDSVVKEFEATGKEIDRLKKEASITEEMKQAKDTFNPDIFPDIKKQNKQDKQEETT